jgi:ABC-type nitrate/sulfonate/bicarbonate transport system substrate-binding protein
VIAVRDEILEKYPEAIKSILNTINETTKTLKTSKYRQDAGR